MLDGEEKTETQTEGTENAEIIDTGGTGDGGGTPSDVSANDAEKKEPSLREALLAATKAAKEKASGETKDKTPEENAEKPKAGFVKDPVTGKFVKSGTENKIPTKETKKGPDGKPLSVAGAQQADKNQPLQPHKMMNKALRDAWPTLAPAVQAALNNRESEMETVITKQDGERQLARRFTETVSPYVAMIRSEGGEPIKAVAELLNTAYKLRTASPQEKGRLLWQTAQQFGADMRQTMQQGQPVFDPRLHEVNQRLASLQGELKKQQSLQQQQEQEGIKRLIETFAADKDTYPYFNDVREDMAALLQGGRAADLQEAYDKAVYANPDIRSALLAAKTVEDEGKRVADQKAKAEKAKKAGSSVRGGPGMTAAKNGQIPANNLRDELKAQFRAHSDS